MVFGETACETCGMPINNTKYFKVGGVFYHMACPDPSIDETVIYGNDSKDGMNGRAL